jgi:ABC-type multidrug transport system permease subunit
VELKKRLILVVFLALLLGVGGLVYWGQRQERLAELYYSGSTRAYITAYISQANQNQLIEFLNRQGLEKIKSPLEGRIRVWFNEDLESRNFIIPGIIALIIMIVGALLTSLVIAREYENGTMETIRSLPVRSVEFLIGKALPYFFIGLVDVLVAILMGQLLFGVVMKASFWLMIMASSIYLGVALSDGDPDDLSADAVAFQFCISKGKYARNFKIGYLYRTGHVLH